MQIGVLALQGAYAKHRAMLAQLGVASCEVRTVTELATVDGLIIPGGESTTMLRLLQDEGLWQPLQQFVRTKPTFGTCAGAILLAQRVTNPTQASLGVLDITVRRNGYGRQVDSFTTSIAAPNLGTSPLEVVFIRAPRITNLGPDVIVLASHQGEPILVQQGITLAATFHPELTADHRVHALLVKLIAANSSGP
jgi:pyridoxal 5'-phosphate synthase pdxT subunit